MLSHLFANININEDDKSAKKKPEIKDGLNLVPNPPSNRGWFSFSRGSEQPKKQKVHIPTDDLLPYAPWFVSQLRFLPETAAYILYQWLSKTKLDVDTNTLEKLKTVLAWRTSMGNGKPLKDFIGTSNKPKLQEPRNSYMVSKFASPPPFPSLNLIVINKILNEADLPSAKNTNSLAGLHHLAQQLELLCGVSEIKRYRGRKRSNGKVTQVAVYASPLTHKERKAKLHKSLYHFRKYNRALEQAGRLRGRIATFQNPFITRTCAKIDKSGLLTEICSNYNFFDKIDVATAVFVSLASAEFSVRKGFTLDSQQQGALDTALEYIYTNILIPSKTTDWALVASIYPLPAVISHVSKPELLELLEKWLVLQIPVAQFLENQWKIGVQGCADKGMMVPYRGSGVDSGGWNRVSGTWNNMVRSVRTISKGLVDGSPLLIKCMKLLAADQMQWAAYAGKEEQVDVKVFVNLAKKGKTCWNVALGKCECTEDDVRKACEEENVDPKRWLGVAQERRKETKESYDMICGVPVPSDAQMQNFMKSLGYYGYKPYSS